MALRSRGQRERDEVRQLGVGDLAILDMSLRDSSKSADAQHCIVMSLSETIPTLATILCEGELRTVHIDFLRRVATV